MNDDNVTVYLGEMLYYIWKGVCEKNRDDCIPTTQSEEQNKQTDVNKAKDTNKKQ